MSPYKVPVMHQVPMGPPQLTWCTSCWWRHAGDVQQFGFRQVPDDGIYTSGMGTAVDEAVPDQSLDAMAAKADAQDPAAEQQVIVLLIPDDVCQRTQALHLTLLKPLPPRLQNLPQENATQAGLDF